MSNWVYIPKYSFKVLSATDDKLILKNWRLLSCLLTFYICQISNVIVQEYMVENQNQCRSQILPLSFVIIKQYGVKYKNLPKNYFSSWSCILGSFKIKMANWEGSQLNQLNGTAQLDWRSKRPSSLHEFDIQICTLLTN